MQSLSRVSIHICNAKKETSVYRFQTMPVPSLNTTSSNGTRAAAKKQPQNFPLKILHCKRKAGIPLMLGFFVLHRKTNSVKDIDIMTVICYNKYANMNKYSYVLNGGFYG